MDTRAAEVQVSEQRLESVADRSAEEIAELLSGGTVEIVVESAMSEWGSLLEEFFHKLERGVNRWYKEGEDKSVIVRFVEPNEAASEG